MTKRKTLREYEDLFENLMEYTNFNSSDEIKNEQDLRKFFKEVGEKAKSDQQKRAFSVASGFGYSKLRARMKDVLNLSQERGKTITGKLNKAKNGRAYGSKEQARMNDALVLFEGKRIYKVNFKTKKNKQVERWRDEKGRFTKSP